MKQIVLDKSKIATVEIGNLFDSASSEGIIAYETLRKNGLGVLFSRNSDNMFGFMYHHHFIYSASTVKYTVHGLKFQSSNRLDSIRLAVEAGRTVFVFDDFNEFVLHAASMIKA